jgi:hypothetical protein
MRWEGKPVGTFTEYSLDRTRLQRDEPYPREDNDIEEVRPGSDCPKESTYIQRIGW